MGAAQAHVVNPAYRFVMNVVIYSEMVDRLISSMTDAGCTRIVAWPENRFFHFLLLLWM